MKKFLAIGLLAVAAFATMTQEAPAFFGKKKSKLIQIKGSDTVLPISQGVAEEFMKANRKAKVAVIGGGSGTGAAALLNGTADIAQMSRAMKAEEKKALSDKGTPVKEIVVAYDCLSIIVNKNNPVSDVTMAEARDIYLGNITNWKEVGGNDEKIILLSRDSSSGTYVSFRKMVLRAGNKKGPEEYTETTIFLPSNEAIKQEAKASAGAVGYIGLGYADDSIKVLKVEGVMPSSATASEYELTRNLYWYVTSELSSDAQKVVDFMMSDNGQAIVKREGYIEVK